MYCNFGAKRVRPNAGANAVVIPERGSVSVQGDAVDISAGALLHLPVCRAYTTAAGCTFPQG